MADIHIQSVCSPFDVPDVAHQAVTTLTRADAMGLIPQGETIDRLDTAVLRGVVEHVSRAGIGRGLLADLSDSACSDPKRLSATLGKINDALDASPVPACEWPGLGRTLGADLLARLLGISMSSLRRYLPGVRSTPDDVAARLHFLALVTGDLAGAYNDIGIRRWFMRPRKLLGNRAPVQLLGRAWQPEDPGPRRVRALARALVPSPAT